jgi:hypothetical protein
MRRNIHFFVFGQIQIRLGLGGEAPDDRHRLAA